MTVSRRNGVGLFTGFEHRDVPTSRGTINAMIGGSSPPLLLLHGYPESLLMWARARSAPGEAPHGGRDRPGRVRHLLPAPAHARPQRPDGYPLEVLDSYRRTLDDAGAVEADRRMRPVTADQPLRRRSRQRQEGPVPIRARDVGARPRGLADILAPIY
jgi:hypothetical protein